MNLGTDTTTVTGMPEETIFIQKQEDGNWVGRMMRFGKLVTMRQSDPQIVLQMLLTHDGK